MNLDQGRKHQPREPGRLRRLVGSWLNFIKLILMALWIVFSAGCAAAVLWTVAKFGWRAGTQFMRWLP